MNLDRVNSGRDVSNDFNVVIEIPMNGDPVMYELDKETGALQVRGKLVFHLHDSR